MKTLKLLLIILVATFSFGAANAQMAHHKKVVMSKRYHRIVKRHRVMVAHHKMDEHHE